MDNMSLRGVQTDFESGKEMITTKVSTITAEQLGEGQEGSPYNLFSSEILLNDTLLGSPTTIDVSIGGFEPYNPFAAKFFLNTATNIKVYTGESLSESAISFYPGQERFSIDKRGYVGINNPDINDERFVTLDVRSARPQMQDPRFPSIIETPGIALTHPYYNEEEGRPPTPRYIGRLKFRSIQDPPGFLSFPTDMAAVQAETDGEANIYKDARLNLALYTNTGDGERRPSLKKHLEINGYEGKTKIFTPLNLGNVPVFRDQEEAVLLGKLVNGDVYQDRLQNLKIVNTNQEAEEPRIR